MFYKPVDLGKLLELRKYIKTQEVVGVSLGAGPIAWTRD